MRYHETLSCVIGHLGSMMGSVLSKDCPKAQPDQIELLENDPQDTHLIPPPKLVSHKCVLQVSTGTLCPP